MFSEIILYFYIERVYKHLFKAIIVNKAFEATLLPRFMEKLFYIHGKNVEVTTEIIDMESIASKDAEEKERRNQPSFLPNKGKRGEIMK